MVHITVLGGGIGGLCAALLLGRRGHHVTVLERDPRRANGDLDEDFFDWQRPGVPHADQPHLLNAPVRSVLRAEAPDVYEAVLRLGARERHEFDWFDEHPPHQPGDEDLVTLRGRRIVLETALRQAVEQQLEVTIRQGVTATGLLTEPRTDRTGRTGRVQVTGVRSSAGPLKAELVIDACGRRSPVPDWLAAATGRSPLVESHRTGLAYFCRWYRLRPGAPEDPGRVRAGASTAFATGGVFPCDNGVFAVSLTLSTTDPTRGALRDPVVFEALARTFPGCADWLALPHDPVGPVRAMAGLDNRWTPLADAEGPLAGGLIGVGDTLVHTNPTLGQGLPLTLFAVQWLAHHAHLADRTDRLAAEYHAWAVETLKPWFDRQVATDRGLQEQLAGDAPHRDPADPVAAALPWCSLEDPVVMRARAQVRHMLLTSQQAYGTPEIRDRVTRWLDARGGRTPEDGGPSRELWEQLAGLRGSGDDSGDDSGGGSGKSGDSAGPGPADWPDRASSTDSAASVPSAVPLLTAVPAQNGCPS